MKIHPRESYNDVIKRIMGNTLKIDQESLIETIEVLSDPEAMRDIAEALEQIERGSKGIPLDEIKKESGL